jgi:hypothetical protein
MLLSAAPARVYVSGLQDESGKWLHDCYRAMEREADLQLAGGGATAADAIDWLLQAL